MIIDMYDIGYMNHIHLPEVLSTQSYLQASLEELSHPLLVSCEKQTQGKGQYDRTWHSFEGTACFSFTWEPPRNIALTSLELGILLCNFLESKFDKKLFLKWPNDIWTHEYKKVGGILTYNTNKYYYNIGIGLNLYPSPGDQASFDYSFALEQEVEKSKFVLELYQYLLENRISPNLISQKWNEKSLLTNKNVFVEQDGIKTEGIFNGVAEDGAALINNQKFYTGSLRISF